MNTIDAIRIQLLHYEKNRFKRRIILRRANRAIKKQNKSTIPSYNSTINYFGGSFTWSQTKEGVEYWSTLSTQIQRLLPINRE